MARGWDKVRERKLYTCKHFNGIANACCEAGINYEDLAGGRAGMARRLPCRANSPLDDGTEAKVVCDRFQLPTWAEVQAEIDEMEQSFRNTVTARKAIMDHIRTTGRSSRATSGNLPCPVCNRGTLRYAIASNGHCHAACTTPDCVVWME